MHYKAIGRYRVYEDGTITSVVYKEERKLKPRLHSHGYYKVCLTIDGKQEDWLVHRLVATLFIDNPDNLPQVDHISGDKSDNSVANLRWVSAYDNYHNLSTISKHYGVRGSKCNYMYKNDKKSYYLKRRYNVDSL